MFSYSVDKTLLSVELNESFVESLEDLETTNFLQDCRERPHSKWQLSLARLMSLVIPDYVVHGLLKLYPMHLISARQWLTLIGGLKEKLLDIGAGQGFATREARTVFKQISTTETSSSMLKILSKHGFVVFKEDLGVSIPKDMEKYDVVSILNVLDRCDFPITMLRNAASLLKEDGLLIIAIALPIKAYVRAVKGARGQLQPLPTTLDLVWEKQMDYFNEQVLKVNDLEVVRWTRLPYIWKNGKPECFSYLDDAVMVCKMVQ